MSDHMKWWDDLTQNEQDGWLEWFNELDDLDTRDERVKTLHIASLEGAFTEECPRCGNQRVDSNNIESWGMFQGVAYEGSALVTWIHGHLEGDSSPKEDMCQSCVIEIN